MSNDLPKWDLPHLQNHLQYAVDLEFWTIPFYMAAMYSIKDPSLEAYRLIQSVVYEEMLHVQMAGNIANAYDHCPTFDAPLYKGKEIPHLDFALDTPDPRKQFDPYSTKIGPLDRERLNTMCLIEYPEWETGHQPDLREKMREYGSIGEFYDAVEVGAAELVAYLKGGRNQVDFFKNFYRDFAQQTVTQDGEAGLKQAVNLIKAITDQGEGQTESKMDIPEEYQNTEDGFHPDWTHFRKFSALFIVSLLRRLLQHIVFHRLLQHMVFPLEFLIFINKVCNVLIAWILFIFWCYNFTAHFLNAPFRKNN